MKLIISVHLFVLTATVLFSCSQSQKPREETGATRDQIEQIEKNTRPLDEKNLPGSAFEQGSFISLKLYLLNGKIVPDSSIATLVRGKFNKGFEQNLFRIECRDASGKVLSAIYTENIFTERSCDDGGKTHIIPIQKGWTEIFLPADAGIAKLVFVENDKASQELDMKPVFEKMRRSEQSPLKKE